MAGVSQNEISEGRAEIERAAVAYIKSKPEVYGKRRSAAKPGKKFNAKITAMVDDLLERFAKLSSRQIGELLNVSHWYVQNRRLATTNSVPKAVAGSFEEKRITHADNVAACNASLAALRAAHPDRQYEDDPRAKSEDRNFELVAVNDGRAHYKADQSHTIQRPITLPTHPFQIAA